jgi:hypothetical protein
MFAVLSIGNSHVLIEESCAGLSTPIYASATYLKKLPALLGSSNKTCSPLLLLMMIGVTGGARYTTHKSPASLTVAPPGSAVATCSAANVWLARWRAEWRHISLWDVFCTVELKQIVSSYDYFNVVPTFLHSAQCSASSGAKNANG